MPSPSPTAIPLPKSTLLSHTREIQKTSLVFSVPMPGTRKKTKYASTSFRVKILWVHSHEKTNMKKTPFQRKGLITEASEVVFYSKRGLAGCTSSNILCRQVWSQVFYRATQDFQVHLNQVLTWDYLISLLVWSQQLPFVTRKMTKPQFPLLDNLARAVLEQESNSKLIRTPMAKVPLIFCLQHCENWRYLLFSFQQQMLEI